MRKICTIFATLCFTLSLCACSSSKLAETYEEGTVIARGKEIVELINIFDYSAINAEVRDDLQDDLPVEKLEQAFAEPVGNSGKFVEYSLITTMGQKSKSTGEDYATAILSCKYENSTIVYTITMDKNMDIVGIHIK